MKDEISDYLIDELNKKVADYQCPICHNNKLQIADGIFMHISHEKDINLSNVGPCYVPTLPVVCPKCGFMSQHVLSLLVGDWEEFKKNYTSNE